MCRMRPTALEFVPKEDMFLSGAEEQNKSNRVEVPQDPLSKDDQEGDNGESQVTDCAEHISLESEADKDFRGTYVPGETLREDRTEECEEETDNSSPSQPEESPPVGPILLPRRSLTTP